MVPKSGNIEDLRKLSQLPKIQRLGLFMIDWQTMDGAPLDGSGVLLYFEHLKLVISGSYFSSPKEIDDGWETGIGFIGDPTHWAEINVPKDVDWNGVV